MIVVGSCERMPNLRMSFFVCVVRAQHSDPAKAKHVCYVQGIRV